MKLPQLVLAFLLLGSCNRKAEEKPSCNPSTQTCLFDVSGLTFEDVEGEVPPEALSFETNLLLVNFNATQQDKIIDAAERIKEVVGSLEFKEAILNHSYQGKKTFVDNGGLTNLQIYYRLLQGAEQLSPAKNNAVDAELELYYDGSATTVGYTTPNTKRIWMNTKFFNNFTPAQVAGNLTHEWLHKLGFGHAASSNSSRPYSVPYAIGYIMKKLAAKQTR